MLNGGRKSKELLDYIKSIKNKNVETVKRKELIDFARWYDELTPYEQGLYQNYDKRAEAYLKSINE